VRKVILLFLILGIGVISSACIHTVAVHQLNKVAMEYSNAGQFDKAASRLESSLDLDDKIYETRYNLAITYIDMDECNKAVEQINIAQNLIKDKDEPAIFYIQGLANACLAKSIYNKKNEDGEIEKIVYKDEAEANSKAKEYVDYLSKSVEALEKYIKIVSITDKNKEITDKINGYRAEIAEYSEKYSL